MSGNYRPEDLIYLSDGPRQGDLLLAPNHIGPVCISSVRNAKPTMGLDHLYEDTGSKTAEGMRIYRLVVPLRLADVDAGAVARVVGANVREGAST